MAQHNPLSVELIHAEIKGRMNEQNAQIATLDTKANFGLGSASLLTAAIIALHSSVEGHGLIVNLLTALSLFAYSAVALFSFLAYKLRTFETPPAPEALMLYYIESQPDETMETLIKEMVDAYNKNLKPIRRKILYTKLTLFSLLVEAGLLMSIACAQIFL